METHDEISGMNNNLCTEDKIVKLRSMFLKEYSSNKKDYDERDMKLWNENFWVERFINYKNQGNSWFD